jgi:hypothetical protein
MASVAAGVVVFAADSLAFVAVVASRSLERARSTVCVTAKSLNNALASLYGVE